MRSAIANHRLPRKRTGHSKRVMHIGGQTDDVLPCKGPERHLHRHLLHGCRDTGRNTAAILIRWCAQVMTPTNFLHTGEEQPAVIFASRAVEFVTCAHVMQCRGGCTYPS